MKAIEFVTPFKAGVPLDIALFSDIHIDSPDCDLTYLKKCFDYCLKNNIHIMIGGDLFDSILLRDSKRAVNHLMEKTDNQLNVKLEETAHFLEPYKQNIIFIGRGNHEDSIIKYSGLDLLQALVTLLNSNEKHQIQYGNYANFIRFNWTNNTGKSVAHYDIFEHHGAGGSAPQTKGMLDFAKLSKGTIADLIWIGHKHNAIADFSDPVMYIDRDGKVKMKNRQLIQTPSFQKGRTIDYNVNFAERFYNHTALSGFAELKLTPYIENDKKKIQSDIKMNVNPYINIGQLQAMKLKLKHRQR